MNLNQFIIQFTTVGNQYLDQDAQKLSELESRIKADLSQEIADSSELSAEAEEAAISFLTRLAQSTPPQGPEENGDLSSVSSGTEVTEVAM